MSTQHVRSLLVALSGALALGCAALAIGHTGIEVPVLSRLGPGGGRAVVVAAVAFAIAALVLFTVAVGVWRARSWAWALGIVVHALVFMGSAFPYRGVASLVAVLISGTSIALLLSRAGRGALLRT